MSVITLSGNGLALLLLNLSTPEGCEERQRVHRAEGRRPKSRGWFSHQLTMEF